MDQTEELRKLINKLEDRIFELETLLKNHGHEGDDGTRRLQKAIDLQPYQTVGAGGVAGLSGADDATANRTTLVMVTGRDETAADGLNNSELILEHQYATETTTRQTFYYGIRAPIFLSANGGKVTSGGDTLQQNQYTWTVDELIGAYVLVQNSAGSDFEVYPIASNTEREITISGGTWGFTTTDSVWYVFMPIYLGSADFPWRRIYTTNGSGGGIRFGFGATNGGQNGLLYLNDSVGNGGLVWRNLAGTSVGIYSGSGAPSFSATKGSLYSRTDGSSSSTRMYINTDGSTAWTNFTTAT